MDKPLGFDLLDWVMAGLVGIIQGIRAYRRSGPGGSDKLLAVSDGLTAVVVWWGLTACSISLYSVARAWLPWLPALPDQAFSALSALVALAGTKEAMAFFMRFKIVREKVDEA